MNSVIVAAYIEHQWLAANKQFMWNVSDLEDQRTNNSTEGHNYRLSLRLKGGKTNFWTLLSLLKTEIKFQNTEYEHFIGQGVFRPRSSKLQRREDEIDNLKELYESGELSMVEFITEMIKFL